MGKIKKISFSRKRLLGRDQFDGAFWDEFYKREWLSETRQALGDTGDKERRLVTITIRDEKTGEEWVIEKVWLVREKGKLVSD